MQRHCTEQPDCFDIDTYAAWYAAGLTAQFFKEKYFKQFFAQTILNPEQYQSRACVLVYFNIQKYITL